CSAAARQGNEDSPALQALIRRQLPAIAERLTETLAKLQRPQEGRDVQVSVASWWEALGRRYRDEGVVLEARGLPDEAQVPQSIFDTVADNLIRNALAKRAAEGAIGVRISLDSAGAIILRVRDAGSAIPDEVAAGLLRAPVSSASGLGIGL